METVLRFLFAVVSMAAMLMSFSVQSAAPPAALDKDVMAALQSLYAKTPAARALGDKAEGILVFPRITKAGFIVGGQGGDGALVRKGKIVGYYNTGAVSVGLQAGAQQYGYALFLMSDSAMQHLKSSNGWELGVGPSIVIVDAGVAKNLSTTTAHSDVYAFIFDQKGLMAGAGLQGSKITSLDR
jgi:lipid-binding SYLF domain-containing protein